MLHRFCFGVDIRFETSHLLLLPFCVLPPGDHEAVMLSDRWVQPKPCTTCKTAKLGAQLPHLYPSMELRWATHYNAQWVRRARAFPELLHGSAVTVIECVVDGQQIVNACAEYIGDQK